MLESCTSFKWPKKSHCWKIRRIILPVFIYRIHSRFWQRVQEFFIRINKHFLCTPENERLRMELFAHDVTVDFTWKWGNLTSLTLLFKSEYYHLRVIVTIIFRADISARAGRLPVRHHVSTRHGAAQIITDNFSTFRSTYVKRYQLIIKKMIPHNK